MKSHLWVKQLPEVRSSTPLNLSSALGGESESVGGDEEKLEAGKGGACQLQQHVLQRLARLRMLSVFNSQYSGAAFTNI